MSNNISDSLILFWETMFDDQTDRLKYDRTVRGIIYSVENVDTGEYKVRYEGNVFYAYAEDVEKKYSVEEEVYIKVPEGDFSNKKIIVGRVTELSLSQGLLNQLSNLVIDISPTFDKLYIYDANNPWKVVAGQLPIESVLGIDYIKSPTNYSNINSYNGLFLQYSSLYEYIQIKASFKTQFHTKPMKGNYGIEVSFFAKDINNNVKTVEYKLDIGSFVGDPYNFTVFSPQQVIIKALKNYLLGLNYIKLFQEDFNFDTRTNYVTNGTTVTPVIELIKTPNIFVDDVLINYVDIIDLTKEPYYCYIAARLGSIFSNANTSPLTLDAILLSYGDPVDEKKCIYKWFERDLSVTIGNQTNPYDKDAGPGWKLMNSKSSNISINSSDIIYLLKYKCVIIYNNQVTMSAEKEISNITNGYAYHIDLVTNGSSIDLQLINDATNDVLKGDWYVSYPDGTYAAFPQGMDKSSISIQDYMEFTSLTFYCAVKGYGPHASQVIGTLEYTVFSASSQEDLSISYIGQEIYRYDANGDATIDDVEEDTKKVRTLLVQLKWKLGIGTSYKVEWFISDNLLHLLLPIPNNKLSAYSPIDSMMLDIWVDNSSVLYYNIKYKYKITAVNNTFTIKITTIDGTVYTFNKEILFIKDGDPGTNGTTYIALIRPCDSNGNKLSGFLGIEYYGLSDWGGDLRLRCYVYKDGTPINNVSGYSIDYDWETTHNLSSITEINDEQYILIFGSGKGLDIFYGNCEERYVKVTVTINDSMNNKTVKIYTFYPIDILVRNNNQDMFPKNIDMSDIPSFIKYTSSGVNPSFYNAHLKFTYKDVDYNDITSLTPQILEIEPKIENGVTRKYLKPASNFIADDTRYVGVLKCNNSQYSSYVIRTIIMYLDTYGNEAINGWDGTRLVIDEANGQYIFAPQIGAGVKNSANLFTGIVMGKDLGQDKIGLYGYQEGISTFGLMQDGSAYFGAKGEGLILINLDPTTGRTTKGTISSGNYTSLTGMQIDLKNGHIDAYNFLVSSKNMTLDSLNGSFEFRLGNFNDDILENDTDGSLLVAPTRYSDSEFKIFFEPGYLYGNTASDVVGSSGKNVFYISGKNNGEYYLLTIDYEPNIRGTKINLKDGKIDSYNFTIKTSNMLLDSNNDKGKFEFDVTNEGIFKIYTTTNNLLYINGADLNTASSSKYYLLSENYLSSAVGGNAGTGTKIDLAKGKITSYQFELDTPYMTVKSSNNGNMNDNNFSFNVYNEGTFKVYWDRPGVGAGIAKNLIYIKGAQYNNDPDTDTGGDTPDNGNFYIQSYDYSLTNKKGMKINLANGKINAYTFKLETDYLTIDSGTDKGIFKLDVGLGSGGKFLITGWQKDNNGNIIGNRKTLIEISNATYKLLSANYNSSTSINLINGVFIDLLHGKLYVGGDAKFKGLISATSLYIGTGTTNVISGSGLTGDAINNSAISSVKIADGAITVTKIQNGAVTGDKIGNGAVTESKIGTGAVSTTKIDGGAITTDKILANAITSNKISANAITSDKIDTGAVVARTILANAITTEKINIGAITTEKISANAITGDKIQANTISGNKLQANSITGDKILANSITGDKILANSISGDKIQANTISGNKLQANSITGDKILANSIDVSNISNINSITTIGNGSITVQNAQTANKKIVLSAPAVEINSISANGNIFIEGPGNTEILLGGIPLGVHFGGTVYIGSRTLEQYIKDVAGA